VWWVVKSEASPLTFVVAFTTAVQAVTNVAFKSRTDSYGTSLYATDITGSFITFALIFTTPLFKL